MEGESLLNDGTAVAFYSRFLSPVQSVVESALCVVLEILGLNARYQIQSGSQSVNGHKGVRT